VSEAAVLHEARDGVGIITLNRPEKFNCISSELIDAMAAARAGLETDPGVRALLVQANGKQFCTGADLDEVLEARGTRVGMQAYLSRFHAMLNGLEASRLPVVAAVHGLALAGGLEVVLACDVVFAAENARLGDQHAQYGLVPGGGGSQRLPRVVGLRRALDLMYSARWLAADEALRWGLVNYLSSPDRLHAEAFDYARTLATRNPQGIGAMKDLARRGLGMGLADGLRYEEAVVVEALRGENVAEGLAAFQARRTPEFR